MPELPEVETVRRTLELAIKSEKIVSVQAIYPNIIQNDVFEFAHQITGQTIHQIDRIGKYLIFILDHDVLIIHLRMEGKFYIKTHEPILKHEHIIIKFESNKELRYHDVRKFGTMQLVPKTSYLNTPPLSKLGLEPKDISPTHFYQKIQLKSIEIKACLLDQHIISGLGNIYVDETLFLSKIHPTRPANQITFKEAEKILVSARSVLDKAILLGGTTIRSYTSSLGVHGRFQNELNVHMKKGEPCPICKTIIIKIKVKGRGTYVCPNCQR